MNVRSRITTSLQSNGTPSRDSMKFWWATLLLKSSFVTRLRSGGSGCINRVTSIRRAKGSKRPGQEIENRTSNAVRYPPRKHLSHRQRAVTLGLAGLSYLDRNSAAVPCRTNREQNVSLQGLPLQKTDMLKSSIMKLDSRGFLLASSSALVL